MRQPTDARRKEVGGVDIVSGAVAQAPSGITTAWQVYVCNVACLPVPDPSPLFPFEVELLHRAFAPSTPPPFPFRMQI
eukprot:scaffold1767_cov56-Isochrysis_galbana.AAC.1